MARDRSPRPRKEREPARKRVTPRGRYSDTPKSVRVCQILEILAWLLPGIFMLLTLIETGMLIEAKMPTWTIIVNLLLASLAAILVWAVLAWLARIGLAVVDIQVASQAGAKSTAELAKAEREEPVESVD